MQTPFNEGITTRNNIPLAIEFMIQNFTQPPTPWWYTMHYHEYLEVLYSLKGDFKLMINGKVIQLPQGSMYIINANEPHATKSVSDGERTLLCIKFIPDILYSNEQSENDMEYTVHFIVDNFGSKRLFSCDELKDTFIPHEFEFLKKEKTDEKFGYELAIKSSVLRIFSFVLRYWYENAGKPDMNTNQRTVSAIRKIRQYVKENYVTATLSEASTRCGLSYSYFSRIFNEYMNMGFSDYVNLVRVNNSLKLLSSTDMSITDIALNVGFSTTSYYIQVFKKLKNMSPGEFRKLFHDKKTVNDTYNRGAIL